MSLTNEDLLAISEMLDKKLQPVNHRLDKLQPVNHRLDKLDNTLNTLKFKQDHLSEKLNGLELTVKYSDHNIRRDIRSLHEDVDTIVEILRIHDMIPLAK